MDNTELTARMMELDERVTRHTEQIKTCFSEIREIKALAESVRRLTTATEILVRDTKAIDGKVDRVSRELQEIKEKPAKQWDKVTTQVITGVIAAVIGYIMGQIGLR